MAADITAVDIDGDGELDAVDSMLADFLEWALQ